MTLMNHQVKWSRLACAVIGASVLGFFGFAAFLQSIHNASVLQKVIETIGLPLFEIGAELGLFWTAIIASLLLWTAVLYVALSVRAARERVQPPA
jgi:cellobiose-specific phosphotransferase system component IIC